MFSMTHCRGYWVHAYKFTYLDELARWTSLWWMTHLSSTIQGYLKIISLVHDIFELTYNWCINACGSICLGTPNSSWSIQLCQLSIIKRFQYIGIFYCFCNFGTILIIIIIIILFSGRTRSESQISKTASHSATKLNSYMDPYLTMCSARFGVDPDYCSGSRAKSGFSDFPHYLRNLPSNLQMQYL